MQIAPIFSYLRLQDQNFLQLSHETSQKVEDQQNFQDLTGFGSSYSIISPFRKKCLNPCDWNFHLNVTYKNDP